MQTHTHTYTHAHTQTTQLLLSRQKERCLGFKVEEVLEVVLFPLSNVKEDRED